MSTLTWASYEVADKTHPYPRAKLVDREELVRLIRESGVRICGNCHQNDSEGAPIVDGVGVAVSMRVWGGIMYDAEHPDEEEGSWNNMGYCQWAWSNEKCQKCGKDRA